MNVIMMMMMVQIMIGLEWNSRESEWEIDSMELVKIVSNKGTKNKR